MSKSKSPVPQKRKRRHDEKLKDSPPIKHKSDRKEGYEKKRKASERSSESPEISNRRTDSKKEKRYRKDESSDRNESRSKNYERYWGGENVEKTKERERYVEKDYQVGSRYYEDPKNVKVEEENRKLEAPVRQKKEMDLLTSRTGGAYIPPARLKMMQAEITDKSSAPYQRISWEALKKSIHGCINKINTGNIGTIIKELLRENIVRGRGLLCRSIIQAQAASPTFTHVYSALVSAINSRFPNIGELLLKRLVIQFKRGFKRNDKSICISAATFIAHLVNQKVAHEILALEILTLLVESPTDDSVEVSIAFLKECGQKLTEVSAKGVNAIFEMLRNILHEGQLDKRVQYMIEVMFQVRKDGFKDHVAVLEELELVPEEDQFTHLIMLDEVTDPQDLLNVFKFDPNYEVNEGKYKELSSEILGSDAESNSDEESGSGSESDSENDEENQENTQKDSVIIDNTETNLIALRRTIYLTIHSSLDFEECAHKLMKMQLKPGQEMELCHMFLDCCAEQRTYEKFYGLLAQRFCQINRIYVSPFEQIFKDSYGTAHRLDTNRLRNISKFFAHLLFTDAIGWEALDCVKLNEEDTTSSSRIFIKIMFQELAEYMGLGKLNERLKDPTLQGAFAGIFPRDNPRNTRFAINFFTSIGLGGLTDELREHLKQVPKTEVQAVIPAVEESSSSSGSSSSSESDSSSSSSSSDSSSSNESSSDSNSSVKNKKKKKKEAATKKKKNINEMNKEGRAMTRKNEDERSLRNIDEQDSHRGKGGGSRRNEDERQWGRNEDEIMSRKNDNERMSRNIDDERMERRKDNERPYRKNDERMERRNEDERPSRKNDDERMERRNDYERMERRNEDERPSRKNESKGMARRNEDERWSRKNEDEGMERRNDDERPYRKNDNERMARRNEDERMERRHDDERPSRKNDERMERRNDYERTERRNDDKSSRKDDERMERRNENVKPSRKNGDERRYDNEKSTRNNEDERKDRKKGDDKSSRKYENEKSRRIEEEDEEPSFYRNESKNVKEKRSSKRDEEKGSSKHKDKSRRND